MRPLPGSGGDGGGEAALSVPPAFPRASPGPPGSLNMSYNYVVTAQKPTAVNGCVTGTAGRGVTRAPCLGRRGSAGMGYRGARGTGDTRGWRCRGALGVPGGFWGTGKGLGVRGGFWGSRVGFGVRGRLGVPGILFTGEFCGTRGFWDTEGFWGRGRIEVLQKSIIGMRESGIWGS